MRQTLRRTVITAATLGIAFTMAPAASAVSPASETNRRITVTLTILGPNGTIFDGTVRTKGHKVTTASGGTHRCDGTNNGANPSPGATPTATLDDAAKKHGFTWDGTWFATYDDYLVTTIAGKNADDQAYWNISVNGTSTPVGGCQFRIKAGDKVAFTWTKL